MFQQCFNTRLYNASISVVALAESLFNAQRRRVNAGIHNVMSISVGGNSVYYWHFDSL